MVVTTFGHRRKGRRKKAGYIEMAIATREKTFCDNVRSALIVAGITQRQFAIETDYHYVTICRILGGNISPTTYFQERAAIALQTDVMALFDPRFKPRRRQSRSRRKKKKSG